MSGSSEVRDHAWVMEQAERLVALGDAEPRSARDPVSQPVINAWLDAIGETDARFTDGLAPPAMSQVWTMPGLRGSRGADDPLSQAMGILDEAGYTAVLGTNCDQTYDRYLRVGEEVAITTRLVSVVGPKRTGVGEGYFVTTLSSWWAGADGEEPERVATMQFRVLKYQPHPDGRDLGGRAASEASGQSSPPDRSLITRPMRNRDTDFFWEGTAAGELRLQTCRACGLLRHPPGPVCPSCHAMDRGWVVASGRGRIFSFVVHHAPQLPGRELPLTVALVELEEGVRMVADVRGAPESLAIGDPVTVGFDRLDEQTTLPVWEVVR